jgi:alpha-beta hydrolase superfamily lysophospholipase
MQNKTYRSFAVRAAASLLLLSFASPTLANDTPQNQSAEATETHQPVFAWPQATRTPRGVVLLLHGLTQRALTLNSLAEQLVSDGYLVYGMDERGQGWWHSHQKKGQPGYKCDFTRSVNDVDQLLVVLKKENPRLPLFVIGESVGAGIAWRAAVDTPEAVDGIIVTGSGTKPGHVKTSWLVGDVLRNCWRWNHQINIVRYQIKYGTDDLPSFIETLNDPEQRKTLSLSEIFGSARFLSKNRKFAREINPRIAVLVIQGTKDQVLNPKSARKVFDDANTLDKQFVEIPGCGHIILGMNNVKPLVQRSITTFLNERTDQDGVAAAPTNLSQEIKDARQNLLECSSIRLP